MTNTELLQKIGIPLDSLKKKYPNTDIDQLSELQLIEISATFLNNVRNTLLKQKENLQIEKEQLKKELKEYKNNELEKLKKELKEIEANETNKLNQKLLEKEHQFNLELSQKEAQLLNKLKEEFDKQFNQKLQKLTQKEKELIKKEQELEEKEILLQEEIKLFKSQKEKELNSLKERLLLQEESFNNSLKEKEVKRLEETKKQIEDLYKNKEEQLQQKEEELSKIEIQLEALKRDLNIKEEELKLKEESIEDRVSSLLKEKQLDFQREIDILSSEIEKLRDEKNQYLEELQELKDIEDVDTAKEIDRKTKEINQLKNLIENVKEEKNRELEKLEELNRELEEKNRNLLKENNFFRIEIEEIDRIKSENRVLQERLKELNLIKEHNEELRQKLESIYSTGKESNLRIEDIKKEPYRKEEVLSFIEIEDEIEYIENIYNKSLEFGVNYPKRILYAFHTAIKSASFAPLTILSGVSGTGKSELPKLYAHFGGFNFLAEAVQPTWDSPESMLGYYNTIENKFDATNILKFLLQTTLSKDESKYGYKDVMNLILLDEINLAHIELYFAEFLSKYELKRGNNNVNLDIKLGAGISYQIPLLSNLLWVGTMNEDETTKTLSDKVLDRSYLINFPRPKEVISRKTLKKLPENDFKHLKVDTWNKWVRNESIFVGEKEDAILEYKNSVNKINHLLAKTGRAIGHRVWQAIEFYISNHPNVLANFDNDTQLNSSIKGAFEEAIVYKIVPKLKGIETIGEERKVLEDIKRELLDKNYKIAQDFENAMKNPYNQFIWKSADYLMEE